MNCSQSLSVNQNVAACKRANVQAPAQQGAATATVAPPGVAPPYDSGAIGLPADARAAAIHRALPQSAAVQTRAGSFKAALLRNSAMPPAANGVHYPAGGWINNIDDGRPSA
jgi:hypothetical protein